LVGFAAAGTVQRSPVLKAHRHVRTSAEIDNFLNPSPACAPGDQDPVQRPPGPQGLAHRMDANEYALVPHWTFIVAHEPI
jgi:hypothetical protein